MAEDVTGARVDDPAGRADPDGTVDVLVVGAGPTGLLAAALLHASGVGVRLIDKSPTQAKESRAFAIHARTLELLLSIGLADAFLDRGTLATGARVYVDGHPTAGFNFALLGRTDTPYPLVLTLPQSETEAILVEHLSRRGIEVERGVVATGLSQDGDGVTVRTAGLDGGERSIRCSYLVGADGAHSMVRHALGLRFEGAPYAQTFLLADCRLEGELEDGPFSAFFHGSHFALWFPLRGERFGRVIATSRQAVGDPSSAAQGSSPATLAEVEDALREAAQRGLRLTDAVWLSRYRVHHRSADRYGEGRVFVAGDAAHIHSPAGGQGMNTGMQDAANLAWKIAAAVKRKTPPGLLGSYDAERRPVGEEVLVATDRLFSIATSTSAWLAAARKVILPLAVGTIGRSGAVRSRAFNLLSELGIHYGPGPAVAEEGGSWADGPAPGRRAPDAVIARKVSVFDLLAGYRFHLLALSGTPLGAGTIEHLAAELDELGRASGLDLGSHLVGHSLVGRHPGIVQAESDAVLPAYGVTGKMAAALYLVRPDGYVAWRAPSFDFAACRAFIAERFGPSVS